VLFQIPFPLQSADEVTEVVMSKVTDNTRLLLIDHVTSPTGLVLPVKGIIQTLKQRGIDTLVDGAHAPGMIPLSIKELGAAYYAGNCHKWLCAPKGAGFLYVQKDRQEAIRPLTISHGANSPRVDRSRFQLEFGWMGTGDPTAALCVPYALNYMESLMPGGWPEIMERNRNLALAGRFVLCQTFNLPPLSPDEMIGSLAAVPVSDSDIDSPSKSSIYYDSWQNELMKRCHIEVPIIPWPNLPQRLVRFSAQLYNSLPQVDLLAEGLKELGDDQV